MTTASTWTPDSWRQSKYRLDQQPSWPVGLEETLKQLRAMTPLIYAGEARKLKTELARVARGDAFVLQAGDCAETFAEFSADRLKNGLKVILQMAVVLTFGAGVPVLKIGRVAGQFAKPRSSDTEKVGEIELPSYRGDMVNRAHFSEEDRTPDPANILKAYEQAVMTLNLLRGFAKGGFADLSAVHEWNREFVESSSEGLRYEAMAEKITSALRFIHACGIDVASMHEVDIYASHEALILDYEEALTRQDSTANGDWYDCSAHMVWVGNRTKQLDSSHIEFLRGIHNPVACKIDAKSTVEQVLGLCETLNPDKEPGRLTFVCRMGTKHVATALGPLIEAVRAADHPVVWLCDPMHGNTFESAGGLKTRHFDEILSEVSAYFAVHRDLGSWPGGIHLELTGENVTECLGGSDDVGHDDLHGNYLTACDPRLNARQSLDLAFRVAELLEDYPAARSAPAFGR